jgi:hypothetical protein
VSMATQHPLQWHKSTACVTGECVEVACRADMVLVRNSCNPEIVVSVPGSQWKKFIASITVLPVARIVSCHDDDEAGVNLC